MASFHVFSELTQPRVYERTEPGLESNLLQVRESGYRILQHTDMYAYCNEELFVRDGTSDSKYGKRMKLVQLIMVEAIHNPAVIPWLENQSDSYKDKADKLEKRVSSKFYAPLTYLRNLPDILSLKLHGEEEKITRWYGRQNVTDQIYRCCEDSAGYRDLAEIAGEINQKYEGMPLREIMVLTEINHPFSGLANRTGIPITFTDANMRDFGVRIQQAVWKIIGTGDPEYPTKALSEEELYGYGFSEE